MKNINPALLDAFARPSCEPGALVEIAFDNPPTDLHYFPSHDWVPLPPGATAYASRLVGLPTLVSQELDPDTAVSTIGSLTFSILDYQGDFSALAAAKLASGDGLRRKRVRVFLAERTVTSWSNMSTPFATQVIDQPISDGTTHRFTCRDAQVLANIIGFRVVKTTLTADLTDSATTISVVSTTGFEMVAHHAGFTDAPSQTVGYVILDEEVIRYTGKTATTFTGCTRGVLGSRAVAHEAGTAADPNRKTAVREWVYWQGNLVKGLRALLIGDLFGQSGATLPAGWHAGISTSWIDEASFTGIGNDLWNTGDDASGKQIWIEGEANVDLKVFIEQQLLTLGGLQLLIDGEGRFSLRRIGSVLPGSASLRRFTPSTRISSTPVEHGYNKVHNLHLIQWARHARRNEFLRTARLIDGPSITRHQIAPQKNFAFRVLNGGIHTENMIESRFNTLRAMYGAPPIEHEVVLPFHNCDLEPGDVTEHAFTHVRDLNTGELLDRPYLITRVEPDLNNMQVKCRIFASTASPGPLAQFAATTVLDDAAYSGTGGTSLVSYLATNYPGKYTDSGGTLTITGEVTLTGHASMTNVAAIYYYLGNITVAAPGAIKWTHNVQLWYRGLFTCGGPVTSIGGGIQATQNGTAGARGFTWGARGIEAYKLIKVGSTQYWAIRGKDNGNPTSGTVVGNPWVAPSAPELHLVNSGTSLAGLPADGRGTAGARGGASCDHNGTCTAASGDIGHGGGSIVFVGRGFTFVGGGFIDNSGLNGGGQNAIDIDARKRIWSGSSGAGYAGQIYFLMDGTSVTLPDINEETIRSKDGIVPAPAGSSVYDPEGDTGKFAINDDKAFNVTWDNRAGREATTNYQSIAKVQFIPPNVAPVADPVDTVNVPTSVTVTSGNSTVLEQADGTTVSRAKMTWTKSTSPNVKGYRLRYKLSAESVYTTYTGLTTKDETQYYFADVKDGSTYHFEIQAVNTYGVESSWVQYSHTVASKTAAPADVSALSLTPGAQGVVVLSWTMTEPADLKHFQIRYSNAASQPSWAAMQVLPNCEAIEPSRRSKEVAGIPLGSYWFAIKAVNRSLIESTNAKFYGTPSQYVITNLKGGISLFSERWASLSGYNQSTTGTGAVALDNAAGKGVKLSATSAGTGTAEIYKYLTEYDSVAGGTIGKTFRGPSVPFRAIEIQIEYTDSNDAMTVYLGTGPVAASSAADEMMMGFKIAAGTLYARSFDDEGLTLDETNLGSLTKDQPVVLMAVYRYEWDGANYGKVSFYKGGALVATHAVTTPGNIMEAGELLYVKLASNGSVAYYDCSINILQADVHYSNR